MGVCVARPTDLVGNIVDWRTTGFRNPFRCSWGEAGWYGREQLVSRKVSVVVDGSSRTRCKEVWRNREDGVLGNSCKVLNRPSPRY